MEGLVRVPVREQEPKVRATNFEEVCYGYNEEEAVAEASRCLNCKNAQCMKGCPVSINIPAFIAQVKERNFEEAYHIISESSALPAVCGRVCPQESQCEGKCIRGFKGDPVAIGKLERFVADWAREHGIKPKKAEKLNGHKVAVIGSGPAGLTCAGDLAKLGYDVTIFEALHRAGGVLSYGIPEFRLPKDKVVAAEVENVKALGVDIETNVVIGKSVKIDELMEKEGFEAVFIREGNGWSCKYARRQWDLVDNKNLTYHYMGDFDKEMLKVLKSVKDFQATPVQEIWHNDGDQVLAYERKDLIFVFNFNPKQSFTDYGFLVTPGAYEVILNTDDVAFGGNGLTDDSVVHFTITDPLYKKEKKEWLKLYIPARTAVVLRKKK